MKPTEYPDTVWAALNEAQRRWVVANWNTWYGSDCREALATGRELTWPPDLAPPPVVEAVVEVPEVTQWSAPVVAESPSQEAAYVLVDPEAAPEVVPPPAVDVPASGEGVTQVFAVDPVVQVEVAWNDHASEAPFGTPYETIPAQVLVEQAQAVEQTPLPAERALYTWAAEVEAEAAAAVSETAIQATLDELIAVTVVSSEPANVDWSESPTLSPASEDAEVIQAGQEAPRAAETFPPAEEPAEPVAGLSDEASGTDEASPEVVTLTEDEAAEDRQTVNAWVEANAPRDEGGPSPEDHVEAFAYIEGRHLHVSVPDGTRLALPLEDTDGSCVLGWAAGNRHGVNASGEGCSLVLRGEALGVAKAVLGIEIAWVDDSMGPVAALGVVHTYADIEEAMAERLGVAA